VKKIIVKTVKKAPREPIQKIVWTRKKTKQGGVVRERGRGPRKDTGQRKDPMQREYGPHGRNSTTMALKKKKPKNEWNGVTRGHHKKERGVPLPN